MSNEVSAALVTGIFTLVGVLLTVGLPLYLQNRKLKGKIAELQHAKEDATLVAQGLAFAYYANFVGTIFDILNHTTIKVCLNPKAVEEERRYESFQHQNVKVYSIIPAQLIGSRMNQCTEKLSKYHVGEIDREGKNQRGFTINYAMESSGTSATLCIYDVAKPLFAMKDYLSYWLSLKESDPEWLEVSGLAVESFQKTLEKLKKDKGVLPEQFNFLIIT